jgi:hypothetical protein
MFDKTIVCDFFLRKPQHRAPTSRQKLKLVFPISTCLKTSLSLTLLENKHHDFSLQHNFFLFLCTVPGTNQVVMEEACGLRPDQEYVFGWFLMTTSSMLLKVRYKNFPVTIVAKDAYIAKLSSYLFNLTLVLHWFAFFNQLTSCQPC